MGIKPGETMGLMCSWIALKGVSKSEFLAAVGLVETDVRREVQPGCGEVDFAYGESPTGWAVVFSEDFEWASRERIVELSRLGPTVGCQFEDKVEMTSIATGAENGLELWRMFHNNEEDVYRLDVSGDPPPEFPAIRDKLFRDQEEDGGEASSVDFIHDIPLEVSRAVCGDRVDEGDAGPFIALKALGLSDEAAVSKRPSNMTFWELTLSLFTGK
jgi:hypothetical protein